MIALVLAACAGGGEPLEDTAGEPTLARVQAEVFGPSCAFSTCHASPGASGLVLEEGRSHEALVDVESADDPGAVLVIPGDSEGSYLMQKLRGDDGIVGVPMPQNGDIDAERLALVAAWIDAGAPND